MRGLKKKEKNNLQKQLREKQNDNDKINNNKNIIKKRTHIHLLNKY